jgi:uncharacterized membrane protein YidH (DUF202 family)
VPRPDPGISNERTALAWQRTALSLMAGSAVLTRLTMEHLGPLALVSVALALPLSLWVFFASRGRYSRDAGIGAKPRSRDGRVPTALTIAIAIVALTEVAALTSPR